MPFNLDHPKNQPTRKLRDFSYSNGVLYIDGKVIKDKKLIQQTLKENGVDFKI